MIVTGVALAATVVVGPHAYGVEPSADRRAVTHRGAPEECADVGFGESNKLDDGDLNFTFGQSHRLLTVQSVTETLRITAIVVIATRDDASAFNLYVPAEPGGLPAEPAWEGLRAPLLGTGGGIPRISRWFACGESVPPETAAARPTGLGGPTTPPGGDSFAASASGPGAEGAGTHVVSTTGAAPTSTVVTATGPRTDPARSPPESEAAGRLAYTGFGNGWLIWFGAALLSTGSAVLVLLRVRRGRG